MIEKAGAAPLVQVIVETGPCAGAQATWRRPGSYLIGRAPAADLVLAHDIVASLEHCRLEIAAGAVTLRDLGGRQGTLLNGGAVEQAPVRSGDSIQAGMSRMKIVIGENEPAAITLAASQAAAPTLGIAAAGLLDIPGYSLERKIGEGGMGVVYAARREATGERVAVKTIMPVAGAGRNSIDLFRREMMLLSQIDHPRIVKFIESGEFAGQVYLVMEFVEAIDLESLLAPLPREKRIAHYCGVICQVLEALAYAHAKKLVHRDVKPRNILVAKENRQLRVKLADFGLAKNFELAGLSQLTGDHEIRGTPAFMPWEQLQSSRYIKPTADIYSTAATLYYYLVGHPPGHSQPQRKSWQSVTSLFTGLVTGQAPPPAQNAALDADLADFPHGLAQILIRALAFEPKHRYASAEEMRTDLLKYAKG
jgi:serine/threonine protein kinase